MNSVNGFTSNDDDDDDQTTLINNRIINSTSDEELFSTGNLVSSNVVPLTSSSGGRPLYKRTFFSMELTTFILFYAYGLTGTILQNQIIFQSCTVRFGYNKSDCALLGTPNASHEILQIETVVQPYAANIIMARSLIESIIPALLSLFIGPWSDKYGRKPVIICTCIGYFLIYLLITCISFISTMVPLNPWTYILAYVPVSFTGGNCALITSMICYITDTTEPKDRALRMSYLEGSLFFGMFCGMLTSSYILNFTSATFVFGLATLVASMAVLLVTFGVKESIHFDESANRLSKFKKLQALFDTRLVYDMFETCFRRRDNLGRSIIWLTICALVISMFALEGTTTVYYLFVRAKFGWTIKDVSFFSSVSIIIQVIGNIVGIIILNKLFGLSESLLAIIAFISSFGDYAITAIAEYSWQLYLASSVAFLKSISGPMCRAILANILPENEIGKIFALTTSIESISTLVAAPLYSLVYTSTLTFYPGAFNLISAGLFILCTLLLILVKIFLKQQPVINYVPIVQTRDVQT